MLNKTILTGLVGSRGYGINTPESDYDYMSVYVPRDLRLFGIDYRAEGAVKDISSTTRSASITSYDFRHFIKLCENMNPNVIPLLWLPKEMYREMDTCGKLLLQHREAFISMRGYESFRGYALGQLERFRNPLDSTGKYGEKRKALVERYGYDTKAAAHAARLVVMFNRLLIEPEKGLMVFLEEPYRSRVMEIRNGEYSKEFVDGFLTSLLSGMESNAKERPLPLAPGRELIENLYWEIICQALPGVVQYTRNGLLDTDNIIFPSAKPQEHSRI